MPQQRRELWYEIVPTRDAVFKNLWKFFKDAIIRSKFLLP